MISSKATPEQIKELVLRGKSKQTASRLTEVEAEIEISRLKLNPKITLTQQQELELYKLPKECTWNWTQKYAQTKLESLLSKRTLEITKRILTSCQSNHLQRFGVSKELSNSWSEEQAEIQLRVFVKEIIESKNRKVQTEKETIMFCGSTKKISYDQKKLLAELNVPEEVFEFLNKSQASTLITKLLKKESTSKITK